MAAGALAQSDYMPPMSGWPAAIQTAWQVQGEYYGSQVQDTTQHVGAWVISRGGTGYSLVILPGGLLSLPGQPYGGWNPVNTRYQGASGPLTVTLNGVAMTGTTSTGGFTSDSLTGSGENRTLYVHTASARYVLQRVKRQSPTLGLKYTQVANIVPTGSTLLSLFDSATGTADLTKWVAGENAVQLKYGLLYRGIKTSQKFNRYFLHIEFLSCFNPTATGQGRANSGVYAQGRYESQVLDSFGLSGAVDEYGGLYSIQAPSVNAELPPQVTRQTYDIYFTPRTSSAAAYFTVYANGVKVQDSTVANITGTGAYISLGTTDEALYLQNHGNEVVFANAWMITSATTQSLPYTGPNSILAAAGIGGTSPIKGSLLIRPLSRKKIDALGFGGTLDLMGRKIIRNGKILSMQPTVLNVPANH